VLEQAIALKPDFAQAHHNLGVARSRGGDSAGAVRAYRDALRCNPGDVSEAAHHLQRATAINPNDARVQELRRRLSGQ
jgi:Flp pilus assembly protein TadD